MIGSGSPRSSPAARSRSAIPRAGRLDLAPASSGRPRRAGTRWPARQRAVQQPPVLADHRRGCPAQVAPPGHVGDVAERADHRDAGALGRVGEPVREDRHADAEDRGTDRRAEQAAYRSSSGCATSATQAGSSSGRVVAIQHRAAGRAVRIERDPVVAAGDLPVLELGLGDRGAGTSRPTATAPRRGTPRRWQDRAGTRAATRPARPRRWSGMKWTSPSRGRGGATSARTRTRPVRSGPGTTRRSCAATPAPARAAPRAPGRRAGEIRVVGQRRFAPHAVVVLHPALGRQPVVVPPDRVEDLLAAHPPEAREQVRVSVRKGVPDMHLPAGGQRGSVYRVDVAATVRPGQTCTTRRSSHRSIHFSSMPSSVGRASAFMAVSVAGA